jgi:prevent-host-death family protein
VATANIYEAKTHLSRLLRRARAGEEIIIADAGRPVARLVPLAAARGPRVLGGDEELVRIGEDFDAALPDAIVDAFYGAAAPSLAVHTKSKTRREKPGVRAVQKRRRSG